MGHLFSTRPRNGDEYTIAPPNSRRCAGSGQHPSAGGNYIADFAGEKSRDGDTPSARTRGGSRSSALYATPRSHAARGIVKVFLGACTSRRGPQHKRADKVIALSRQSLPRRVWPPRSHARGRSLPLPYYTPTHVHDDLAAETWTSSDCATSAGDARLPVDRSRQNAFTSRSGSRKRGEDAHTGLLPAGARNYDAQGLVTTRRRGTSSCSVSTTYRRHDFLARIP